MNIAGLLACAALSVSAWAHADKATAATDVPNAIAAINAVVATAATDSADATLYSVPVAVCGEATRHADRPATAQVRADGRHFRAADGRYVLLRGVNATGDAKVPPFKALTSPALLDPLPGWGINTIRFLFNWEAFEPAPCDFSEDYLAYYEQGVKWAAERGIYVIVDFHQDAFSRYALHGCGEGAPLWALTDRVTPATPDNGPNCAGWGTKATFSAENYLVFRRFFKDDKQALSHYVAMLGRVASRLAQYPNVIGYDMLNEPWSNAATLNPFYARAGATIRQMYPSAMLFFEPELPVIGPLLPVAFSAVKPPPLGNVVLAPHYYNGELFALKFWLGDSPGRVLDKWKSKADAWNIPMLLGEFGVFPEVKNSAAYIAAIYQWLDRGLVSGTQWSYTPGWTEQAKDGWNNENLSIVDSRLQLRSAVFQPRPYPQKTAGKPVAFDPRAAEFSYTWDNDPALGNGKTEFYLPDGYADGKLWHTAASPPWALVVCSITGRHQAVCQSDYRGQVTVVLK